MRPRPRGSRAFNLRNRIPALAALDETDPRLQRAAPVPQWSPTHPPRLSVPHRRARVGRGDAERREVVLLVDTFNRYFEPENARAAERVLTARRLSRHRRRDPAVGRPLCCGRTFLGAGLVDEARQEARRMLDALAPHIARRHADRRARTGLSADLARRIPGDVARTRDAGRSPSTPSFSRNSSPPSARRAASS